MVHLSRGVAAIAKQGVDAATVTASSKASQQLFFLGGQSTGAPSLTGPWPEEGMGEEEGEVRKRRRGTVSR